MDTRQELELLIDKLIEDYKKKENEASKLWKRIDELEKNNKEMKEVTNEMKIKIESSNKTIESLIERIRSKMTTENK